MEDEERSKDEEKRVKIWIEKGVEKSEKENEGKGREEKAK